MSNYQKWVAKVGIEEARRISLERCHRSRIKHGKMSADGPRKQLTREEKLARRRAWAEKNRGHLRDYARDFYAKNADEIKKEMSERYKSDPAKWAARVKAKRALKAGKIVRSDCCSVCMRSGVVLEMHHTDYTKPLVIEWLCLRCHRRLHAMLKGHVPRGRTANDEVVKAKQVARHVFQRAVKAGEITKPETCSRCGSTEAIEAHHRDYSRPLDVEWMCRSCHRGLGHTQSRGQQDSALPGSVPAVRTTGEREPPSPDSPG